MHPKKKYITDFSKEDLLLRLKPEFSEILNSCKRAKELSTLGIVLCSKQFTSKAEDVLLLGMITTYILKYENLAVFITEKEVENEVSYLLDYSDINKFLDN